MGILRTIRSLMSVKSLDDKGVAMSKLSEYLKDPETRHQIYADLAAGKGQSTVPDPSTGKLVTLTVRREDVPPQEERRKAKEG